MNSGIVREVSVADWQREEVEANTLTEAVTRELATSLARLMRNRVIRCGSQRHFAKLLTAIRDAYNLKMLGSPTGAQLQRELRDAEAESIACVVDPRGLYLHARQIAGANVSGGTYSAWGELYSVVLPLTPSKSKAVFQFGIAAITILPQFRATAISAEARGECPARTLAAETAGTLHRRFCILLAAPGIDALHKRAGAIAVQTIAPGVVRSAGTAGAGNFAQAVRAGAASVAPPRVGAGVPIITVNAAQRVAQTRMHHWFTTRRRQRPQERSRRLQVCVFLIFSVLKPRVVAQPVGAPGMQETSAAPPPADMSQKSTDIAAEVTVGEGDTTDKECEDDAQTRLLDVRAVRAADESDPAAANIGKRNKP